MTHNEEELTKVFLTAITILKDNGIIRKRLFLFNGIENYAFPEASV